MSGNMKINKITTIEDRKRPNYGKTRRVQKTERLTKIIIQEIF